MSSVVRVSVLGATGSIGTSTLDVLRDAREGGPRFNVVALAARNNVVDLARLAKEFHADVAVIADEARFEDLRDALAGTGIEATAGDAALEEAAGRDCDVTVAGIVGIAGLRSTLAAVRRGGAVALANKESMVCAGPLLKRAAADSGAKFLPIDSEHNAIFQVLDQPERVEKLILTASGGPFRQKTKVEMQSVTPEMACAHPNWSMGAKISVDSATMMNKGLELIEAVHLFDVPESKIDILVHPQSVIHSLVQYDDGSVLAQLGMPDMKIPISYALAWPNRMALPKLERLDLAGVGRLDFSAPDAEQFPALTLARVAAREGARASIALNSANEIGVEAFLQQKTGFLDIADSARKVMDDIDQRTDLPNPDSLGDIMVIDRVVRDCAQRRLGLAG